MGLLTAIANMPSSQLDQILKLLPSLSVVERGVVLGRIRILGAAITPKRDVVADVYSTVNGLLGLGAIGIDRFRKMRSYRQFARAVDRVEHYIDDVFGAQDFHDRNQIMVLLLGLCIDRVKQKRHGVAIWELSVAMCQVDEIVDSAFPGYRESGMLADALIHGLEEQS